MTVASATLRLTRYIPHEPHPPQIAFLALDELEAFYGGAAGGGKSDALLMAALQYVDQPGYAALILRRTFPELSQPGAVMARAHEWLQGTDAVWNEQRKRWRFPSGATLTFGYLRHEQDVYQYQGAEFQYVGVDELTQFHEGQYLYLFSRLRRLEGSDVPIRMRSASNPGNVGHGWVKARFIVGRLPDRIFIPAKLSDNPSVDQAEYETSLDKLSPVLRRQLLEGDWDTFEGAAYQLIDDTHLVDRMELPDSFDRFECMDHGVTNPTAWYLAATDYDGNVIVADEYYRAGMPDEHVKEILDRRNEWWAARDTDGKPVPHPCWGDPASLRETMPMRGRLGEPATLQSEYLHLGVVIAPGNNRRRAGFVRIAALLKPQEARRFPVWHPRAGEYGASRLFIVAARCPMLVEQLRNAPLASEETDPERGEAVDRRWEGPYGHGHAALRYGVLSLPDASVEPVPELEDPRARLLARVEKRFVEDNPYDYYLN